jgi:hypothetical protein
MQFRPIPLPPLDPFILFSEFNSFSGAVSRIATGITGACLRGFAQALGRGTCVFLQIAQHRKIRNNEFDQTDRLLREQTAFAIRSKAVASRFLAAGTETVGTGAREYDCPGRLRWLAVRRFNASAPGFRRDSRKSRDQTCGPASRLRRISPAADRGGIWCLPCPHAARS